MTVRDGIGTRIVLLGALVLAWIALFLWLGRRSDTIDFWGIMLIGAALITFFGILQMPGSIDGEGTFRESQIRLAIAAALVVAYLVYFGSVVYLDPPQTADGQAMESFAQDLLPTLTNLLMVAISFYFGSTAAIEIAGAMSKRENREAKTD